MKLAAWVPGGLVGIPGKQADQGCRTGPLMGQTQVLLVIKIGPLLRDQGRLQSGLLPQVAHFLTSIRINSLWQLLPSLLTPLPAYNLASPLTTLTKPSSW